LPLVLSYKISGGRMTGRAKRIEYFMVISALISFFAFTGSAFAQCGRVPLQEALDAMVGDAEVTVTQVAVPWPSGQSYNPQYYYEFKPVGVSPRDGFIIYPGADVDERAYAVLARSIAKAGFLVALVPMPGCLAFYGIGRADAVINNNPGITTWSIGGHSFGGVAACWYVYNNNGTFTNSSKINGVVLWASYPDSSQPLTSKPVKVISLWGTKDALTTETSINNSKPYLPADTYYIGLKGANHTQFGWYGEAVDDYDYLSVGSSGQVDNPADISRQQQGDLLASYTVNFLDSLTPATLNVPAAVDEVTADDGSVWQKVSFPGFVDCNNTDIVALTPYKGNLYALTRNDVSGFELWQTDPAYGWHRIHVQGFTDQSNYCGYLQLPNPANPFQYLTPSVKYSPNMNIWADMIEFNNHLYVAVSTGYQGSALFGSRGALIWRTDGVAWEPVIGGQAPVAQGTLTAISSCSNDDGSTTATFTDSSKNWAVNSLVGGIIAVDAEFTSFTHGQTGVTVPGKRLFRITANTANTLTVQQNEVANTTQSTRCDEYLAGGGDPGRPRNNMPRVVVGAGYTITKGDDSQGFGDPWNKSIIDFEILNGELFASIGLNYQQGARVMKTADGLTWVADSPYSFGNIHGYDWHDGSVLATCPGGSEARGAPVSSSATKMIKSSVNGQETLYIGGTGTGGCNGRGARVYRRDGAGVWTPIVDVLVDSNTTGTNENGFGYLPYNNDFFYSAFQAWSWAEYQGRVFVGIARLEGGGMIMYTPNGSDSDGAWQFAMGANSLQNTTDPFEIINYAPLYDPAYTGFGDVLNTASYVHTFNGVLYAGTMVTNLSLYYSNPLDGADMWKGTWNNGTNQIDWTLVNSTGFGDSTVLQFESFADFGNAMYVAAATVNPSDFRGQEPANYTGAKIYRLQVPVTTTTTTAPVTTTTTAPPTTTTTAASTTTTTAEPTLIELSSFEAKGVWRGIILAWETESEIDNVGFNIYRAEAEDGEYIKINASLIPARGSVAQGAAYKFVDWKVEKDKTYYYKLEDIDRSGIAAQHGPVSASTWSLLSFIKR
jgi:hypothetical protein